MTGTQWLLLISFAVTLIFACLLLIDAVARGRPSGKMLQLAAAYRRYAPSAPQSEASALPGRNRRRRLTLLVLAVLVVLSVVWFGFLLSRAPGGRAVGLTSTHSVAHDGPSSSAGRSRASEPKSGSPVEQQNIELEDLAKFARPFQAVRIQGMYHGGADTILRVQRWEGGQWLAFPLPTKTDQSGRFTAYVELGQPGRYRLRVLDPESGVKSKPFVLVIKS
jgi:hypothetical protein